MKLTELLIELALEADAASVSQGKDVLELEKAMGDAFKTIGAEFAAHKDEVEQDVEQADVPVSESLSVASIIGILLAMPKVVELLGKGLQKLTVVYKKFFKKGQAQTEEEKVQVAEKIIEFSHKWHKMYIKGLKYLLKISGVFKKVGIKSDAAQNKVAEVLYYTILAGLAVYSGVGAFGAFKAASTSAAHGSEIALGALEGAMAAVKSGEVTQFLTKLAIH